MPVAPALADLHWQPLHEDAWLSVRIDESGRVVHYARRRAHFELVEHLEASHQAVLTALQTVPRTQVGLLVDLRDTPEAHAAPPSGRPALRKELIEAAMARHRPKLLRDFGRLAFVLRTAVGKLQLDRHLRNDGFTAHITSDEREALAHLLGAAP